MTSCRCVRLRVDGGTSATVRVNDPPAVTFGSSAYVPYVPQVDEYQGPYQVTPTESAQVLETDTLHMDDDVTVDAIPSGYVGSTVDRRDSDDLAASGATVTAPAGYYAEPASKAVASGSITMRKPTMDEAVGEIRSRADLTTGYIAGGSYSGSALILDKQAGATITPTESEQVAVPQYRWTTGDVKVAAIPSQYIVPTGTYTVTGSGTHDVTQYASASVASATPTNDSDSEYITSSGVRKWRYRPKTIVPTAGWAAQRSASNPINGFWQTFDAIPTGTTVTPTTSSQTIGGADTMLEGAVTVSAVPVGTEGTPSAAKSVSGHTATVTPSVTNAAGLIGGGTHTGSAVTVSASELVSGSETKTANGTYDVTNLAEVVVNVAGSAAKTATGTFTGNGTRTIDVACTFEPDIVYFTSNPGTTASSGTVAAIIVRDMMTATRYRNNATTNSHYAIPDIANLNTSGSSYSWRATYNSTTSKVTLYCYSSNARGLLTNGRTYSYTFIKWT